MNWCVPPDEVVSSPHQVGDQTTVVGESSTPTDQEMDAHAEVITRWSKSQPAGRNSEVGS
jgi:hypothetical protein